MRYKSALAHTDVCIDRKDRPQWGELTAADFSGMDGKVVVDGRRNLRHEAKKGVELHVLGG